MAMPFPFLPSIKYSVLKHTMKERLAFIIGLLGLVHVAFAQQEALFTNYLFNSLTFNPAYAGTTEYLTATLIHRSQWLGLNRGLGGRDDGAPSSQSFSLHSPANDRVGLGMSLVRDAIGATRTNHLNFIYAYRIPFQSGTLSIGVQAGATHWRANWRELDFKDPQALDPAFNGEIISDWVPNIGAGIYYYHEYFYVGLSAPRLMRFTLLPRREFISDFTALAHLYPHFYLTGGGVFRYGPELVIKPTLLVRRTGVFENWVVSKSQQVSTPTAVDVGISAFVLETLWLGLNFRTAFEKRSSADSIDLWAAFYLDNGLRVGMGYDFLLSQLNNYSGGSLELMLTYDFNYNISNIDSPRYF